MKRRKGKQPSFRRRKPRYFPRESTLIVCEGKTEKIYFKELRKKLGLLKIEIEVVDNTDGSHPVNVVEHAIQKQEKRKLEAKSISLTEYDSVWCICDTEANRPRLGEALDRAKSNHVEVALSNPCFEYWYILHFKKTTQPFHNCSEAVKALRKHFLEYKKNNTAIFLEVYDSTDRAIKRAESLRKSRLNGDFVKDCNPSTDVHVLVKHLKEIAHQPVKKCYQ